MNQADETPQKATASASYVGGDLPIWAGPLVRWVGIYRYVDRGDDTHPGVRAWLWRWFGQWWFLTTTRAKGWTVLLTPGGRPIAIGFGRPLRFGVERKPGQTVILAGLLGVGLLHGRDRERAVEDLTDVRGFVAERINDAVRRLGPTP